MKRQILCLMLVLSIVSSFITATPVTVSAAASGTCGDNLTWTLDDEGILTISGTGEMTNWLCEFEAPWSDYIFEITSIVIEEGVSSIGDYAFACCTELKKIILPDTLTTIGISSFFNCYSMKFLKIGRNVTTIGMDAFSDCYELETLILFDKISEIGDRSFSSCPSLRKTFYSSTEEKWKKVRIGEGNECLEYYDIKFNHNGDLKIAADIAYCNYADNKLRVSIPFGYVFEDGVLVFAIYNNAGNLLFVTTKPFSKNESEIKFEYDANEEIIGMNAKVFFWKSMNSISPIDPPINTIVEHKFIPDIIMETSDRNTAHITHKYVYPGASKSIDVTFSDDSFLNGAYIEIYGANNQYIKTYNGDELAGETINIPGNTLIIEYINHSSGYSHFKTTKIVVNM